MPAQYVKAYIKRNKHDAADAEAICEAAADGQPIGSISATERPPQPFPWI
jgi:transposase